MIRGVQYTYVHANPDVQVLSSPDSVQEKNVFLMLIYPRRGEIFECHVSVEHSGGLVGDTARRDFHIRY